MIKRQILVGCCGIFLLIGTSCVEYSPKPRGYFRIEPTKAVYQSLNLEDLPFDFNVSKSVIVELPEKDQSFQGLNLSYPELSAKVYCSYLPIGPATFSSVHSESRSFVARQLKPDTRIAEKAYSNPDAKVFGSLFLLEGELASPVQFFLTDSVSHFFRGALYFDCKPNVDSLAPAIQYIREDIIELMQTFSWKD